MSKEQQENEDWHTAEIIFGRLIAVDRYSEFIVVEYKDSEENWVREEYYTEKYFSDERKWEQLFDELRKRLGSDIELRVIDDQVESFK